MCISGHMNQQLQNSKVGQMHQYISTQVYVSVYKMSAYKWIYCFSLETSLVYVKHMLTTRENVLITLCAVIHGDRGWIKLPWQRSWSVMWWTATSNHVHAALFKVFLTNLPYLTTQLTSEMWGILSQLFVSPHKQTPGADPFIQMETWNKWLHYINIMPATPTCKNMMWSRD